MSIKIYFKGPEGRCERRAQVPGDVSQIVKQIAADGGRFIKVGASFHTALTYEAWLIAAKNVSTDGEDAIDA